MKISRLTAPLAAAALLFGTAGCTNDDGGSRSSVDASLISHIAPDPAAEELLPQDVRDRGVLRIGINPNYPPNEFKDASGAPAGWGVDLGDAVAAKLGLKPEWQSMQFDSIIPRIHGGTLDMSSSSFTDTVERQKSVDFVDYYEAGSQWVSPKGKPVDPNRACGLRIAVKATTVQETVELPARSEKCVAAGKEPLRVVAFSLQPEATQAVASGGADAFSADSPIAGDAVAQLGDHLQLSGDVFDAAPYGLVTPRGSALTRAVQAAVQSLMDDGTYGKILRGAGVESGAVDRATVNGARA